VTRPARPLITIKNWKRWQHYRKRNPPWIKLHRSLLDEDECAWYRGLSDNAARWLIELWLLATREAGTVPYDSLIILRDTRRPTSDKPLLDMALTELASAGAITLAGTDASADFLATLAPVLSPRGTEIQRYREAETVASQPAAPSGNSTPQAEAAPPGEPNAYAVLMPLIRTHLWHPDGKPPDAIKGEPWTEQREGSVVRELLKHYSLSQLETVVLGLGLMLRGLAESERPAWLPLGEKCSLRAVFHTKSGVVAMVELCQRAYWTVQNKRPKSAPAGPTPVGHLLGTVIP
jgi:hypothetical protein